MAMARASSGPAYPERFYVALYQQLTRIEFPLTDFSYACQTWKSGESGFQENEFLETNKALGDLGVAIEVF
ncbi:hypothetical protein NC653_024590 [Populus alba x Populus x berolinensis]|uniref:Uncharacterized protein n=1 Tax=Populus alba x Populus x berolinensis TaxID=444605 RepID=A0AAD6Q6Z7_9ROSI|nr:hypothetical protein NC653_024590 [Populus alba x Populus x berolinensis]